MAEASTEKKISFELERFEWLVNCQAEETFEQLLFLLRDLNCNYGMWGGGFKVHSLFPGADLTHVCTRLAAALTTLFSRPGLTVDRNLFEALMDHHRWLALIFAVSSFRNADHIIRTQNAAGGGVSDRIALTPSNLRLFCLCYFPDSEIPLQLDLLWATDKHTVVRLFFCLLSGRAAPTHAAHAKREYILKWLPSRMHEISSIDALPSAVLHDVYMHCSYANLNEKHAIKACINRLIRLQLLSLGYQDNQPLWGRKKPVVVVVLEWFTKQHSIYRTHSTTINAMRSHFRVVGIGREGCTDAVSRQVFDEFHSTQGFNDIEETYSLIKEIRPDVLYYPSVGMFPLTMYLTNLRLAQLQVVALGHPATTHSSYIDGVIVEEDYVGDESCFSEPLIKVPKHANPYIPIVNVNVAASNRVGPQPGLVRVAVCASPMKINPGFLLTLAHIQQRSGTPIQFVFYLGVEFGIIYEYLRVAIIDKLPSAQVLPRLPVENYQQDLNKCHLFANPFPFGNTNGLVDCVRLALPGVCLTGPEVHSHIDEGLFKRLGLPDELIALEHKDYVNAMLRLVNDSVYRDSIHQKLLLSDVDSLLFRGRPELFVNEIRSLRAEKMALA